MKDPHLTDTAILIAYKRRLERSDIGPTEHGVYRRHYIDKIDELRRDHYGIRGDLMEFYFKLMGRSTDV